MKKQVVNLNNKPVNEVDLPDFIFNIKVLPDLIHQYLRYQNQKDEIIIIDELKLNSHKTKELASILKNFNFNSALFVCDTYKLDQNFKRASQNIPKVSLLSQSGVNVKDLIHHEKIFLLKDSIDVISKRLT